MATIKPFIRTSVKNKKAKIRFRLSDGTDVQIFFISEMEIDPLHFDSKKGCIKDRIIVDEEYRYKVNTYIANIKDIISQIYNKRKSTDIVSSEWLTEKVNDQLYCKEEEVVKLDFTTLFEMFLSQSQVCRSRLRHYKSTLRLLDRFTSYMKLKNTSFELNLLTIEADVWYNFINYTQNEGDLISKSRRVFNDDDIKSNRSYNTTMSIWKRVKAFLNWAILNKYSANVSHKMVKVKTEVYSTPYYITIEERNMIYNFDFSSNKRLEIQRDIFIFHCLIGCRVGDLVKLKKNSIINGSVEYVANKTIKESARIIRVPLNETALSIIQKYSEYAGDILLPFITPQKYNDAIKEIFNTVELKRLVTVIDGVTGRENKVPINTVASSHMARRTFVGNLYKKVKDPNLIGSLSGHCEGSKAFARYREIDEDIKKELISMLD